MATYYVATTGDNGNAGTEGSPWLTVTYGVAQLSAGDTLYLKGGTYYEDQVEVTSSGTAGSVITLASAPGEWAIIDGTLSSLPGTVSDGLIHFGATTYNYWTIENLEIANSPDFNIWTEGEHITLNNIISHDSTYSGTFHRAGDYYTITNCEVYDNGWNGIAVEDTSHVIIRNNTVYDNLYHNGINIFPHTTGEFWGYLDDVLIEDNIVTNNEHGMYIRYVTNGIIRNNVIVGNGIADQNGIGIYLHLYGPAPVPEVWDANITIYNNTITGSWMEALVIEKVSYVTVRNNIFALNFQRRYTEGEITTDREVSISGEDLTNLDFDYDLYQLNPENTDQNVINFGHVYNGCTAGRKPIASLRTCSGWETAGLVGDPDFDASYKLGANSEAIDVGVSLAATFTDDLEGTERPIGDAWDMGAYEYDPDAPEEPTAGTLVMVLQ